MDAVLTATALGLAVGLGIAVPLGAIGVLLLQTGMAAGWRTAAAGGLGAAAVDLVYAAAAVAAGTAVAGALAAQSRSVQVLGAVVLALVAVRGVVGLVRPDTTSAPVSVPGAPSPAAGSCADVAPSSVATGCVGARRSSGTLTAAPARAAVRAPSPWRTFLRFVALTAVNPLTVVFFVAVSAGLADRLATPAAAAAFVVGIGAASAAWQLALAATGALLGARVSPRLRTLLSLAGYAVVGGFAVALALP
jgi:threonine/homoserine/homoserine lactone efflux protein